MSEVVEEELVRMTRRMIQSFVYANCWNSSDHESEAMWRLYSREGIAVQSTYRRLVLSLGTFKDKGIRVQPVTYRGPEDITYISNLNESMIIEPAA